jgi:apolipoprotein D and lipocalin family protein
MNTTSHRSLRLTITRTARLWSTQLLIVLGLLWTSTPAFTQEIAPLATISSLDLKRYEGQWYELAKFPNRFQSMCVRATSAQYSINNEGVSVLNQCVNDKGLVVQVLGQARPVGVVQAGQLQPAKLEVAFAPSWLRWLPVVWGNYWVVALDPDYQWSLVSEPKREFAWVLARNNQLTPSQKEAVLQALRVNGLDEKKLEWTPH